MLAGGRPRVYRRGMSKNSPTDEFRREPVRDAVVVDGLTVRRGGKTVLEDLDARIAAGRITGLLGPSGGGKSTLIRSIVGVQKTAAGRVSVLGEPAGSAALRRRVAYCTQSPSVYQDLTVEENLRYFARILRAEKGAVERVLETVDLTAAARRAAGGLSGGQLSRVSLAAALLLDPELLVLDEPTVGLDPVLRAALWDLFRRLVDEGRTILVSSHVMDEASRCDDLLFLREGEIIAHEPLASLMARTGTRDAESAFLAVVGHRGEAAEASSGEDRTASDYAPRHAAHESGRPLGRTTPEETR